MRGFLASVLFGLVLGAVSVAALDLSVTQKLRSGDNKCTTADFCD